MDDLVIVEIARVRARLDNGESRDEVLRDVGKTSDGWQRDEESLLAVLSDDIETGRTERVLRFHEVYAKLRGPEPTRVATSSLDAPAPVGLEPGLRAPMPVAALTNATIDETAMLPKEALGSAWPFQAPTDGAPKMISVAALMRGNPGSTGTRELDADEVVPRPVSLSALPQTTGEIDRAQLGLPAVPFSGSNPPPPPRSAAEGVLQSDQTLLAGDTAVDAPAIPFVAEDALIPLEQYAEITALLTKEGDPMKTFKRLGIDPASWLSTVRTYSKRFATDPALEAKFDMLVRNFSR